MRFVVAVCIDSARPETAHEADGGAAKECACLANPDWPLPCIGAVPPSAQVKVEEEGVQAAVPPSQAGKALPAAPTPGRNGSLQQRSWTLVQGSTEAMAGHS